MKDWSTPRDELICGKIDEAERIAAKAELVEIMMILQYIRRDAERMEQGLIRRKDEVAALSAKNRRLRISQLRRMADGIEELRRRAYLFAVVKNGGSFDFGRSVRIDEKIDRFRVACLAEIERLRGEG